MIAIALITFVSLGILLAMIALSLHIQDVLDRRTEREMTPLAKAILNHIAENNRNER